MTKQFYTTNMYVKLYFPSELLISGLFFKIKRRRKRLPGWIYCFFTGAKNIVNFIEIITSIFENAIINNQINILFLIQVRTFYEFVYRYMGVCVKYDDIKNYGELYL